MRVNKGYWSIQSIQGIQGNQGIYLQLKSKNRGSRISDSPSFILQFRDHIFIEEDRSVPFLVFIV